MKELRRNMRIIGTLIVALFLCAGAWYGVTVYTQGDVWASDVYNPRLARSSSDRGDITDRDGVVLATSQDGQRVYLEDAAVRRSLAATVGDTAGMSGTGVEGYYSA